MTRLKRSSFQSCGMSQDRPRERRCPGVDSYENVVFALRDPAGSTDSYSVTILDSTNATVPGHSVSESEVSTSEMQIWN